MPLDKLTARQFLELGEAKGWKLKAIVKEVPVCSGRRFLLGFNYSKRSSKRKYTWLLSNMMPLAAEKKEATT